MRHKIFWCLTIIWMIVIFFFSSMEGEESHDSSVGLINITIRNVVSLFSDFSEEELDDIVDTINYPIRKISHMMEYGLLFFFLVMAIDNKKYSFIITLIYSISDEIHQLFVPGRAGMVSDVLIDMIGVLAFYLLIILFERLKKIKNN